MLFSVSVWRAIARYAECPLLFLFCLRACLLCCVRYSDKLFSLSLSRSPTPFRSVCPLAQVHPGEHAPPKIRGRGGIDNKTSLIFFFVVHFLIVRVSHTAQLRCICLSFLIVGVIGQDFAHNGRKKSCRVILIRKRQKRPQ